MHIRRTIVLALAATLIGAGTIAPTTAEAATKPAWTKSCTALNKKYPHGVGKAKAVDRDSKGKAIKKGVKNFKKSDAIYAQAMKYNKGLDRDKDGIACEKK